MWQWKWLAYETGTSSTVLIPLINRGGKRGWEHGRFACSEVFGLVSLPILQCWRFKTLSFHMRGMCPMRETTALRYMTWSPQFLCLWNSLQRSNPRQSQIMSKEFLILPFTTILQITIFACQVPQSLGGPWGKKLSHLYLRRKPVVADPWAENYISDIWRSGHEEKQVYVGIRICSSC